MRSNLLPRCPLVLVAMIFPFAGSKAAAGDEDASNKAAFAMPIEEFRGLSEADQKTFLVSAFEHRLEHAKNIKYEALQKINISRYEDGKPIKVIEWLNGSRLRHCVLGESFRMDTTRGGVDVSNPQRVVVCGLNAESGVVRSTAKYSDRDRSFGRIGTKVDRINDSNQYAYWLNGEHQANSPILADYIFCYLVDHRDEYTIEAPEGEDKVRLTVPWYRRWNEEPLGTRTFTLDPKKGFLPIHGKGRWELKRERGKPFWRSVEFFVEDSLLVGDVWMPIQLKEILGGNPLEEVHGKGAFDVIEITVSMIEVGTVTPEDLEVPFPPGMEIVDAIKGVAYVVGENNERTKVEPVVGAAALPPEPTPDPKQSGNFRYLLIWLNVAALAVILSVVAYRRFAKRRRASES